MNRNWLGIVFCLGLLASGGAAAQAFPEKPVRFIVPWTAGGGVDLHARMVAAKLSERLKQPVIVENKPGAAGIIGTEFVAKSPADGYTLIVGSPGNMSVNPVFNPSTPYNPVADFAPVGMSARISNVLVVTPSLPAKTVSEFIELARSKPGELTFGSSGQGSVLHLQMELLLLHTKTKMRHIPYKGTSQAVGDVVSGHTVSMIADPSVLPFVKAGKLRILGQITGTRSLAMPDVPTLAESGLPGFDAPSWYGFFAPANTPRAVVAKLNAEINNVLKDPDLIRTMVAAGQDPAPSTPQELGEYHSKEIALWKKVITEANIQQ
ncbi:MAG: Bug family tripartite tricarboxylate transporter substrate binding protein [Bradyrhizobium sp.]|uniref:Bug family tripartite tricarboxylate transporter substrate binding protein n=1 Tax=Bradyrhizobium sp. TaxID=376 RepID=UPI003D0B66F0